MSDKYYVVLDYQDPGYEFDTWDEAREYLVTAEEDGKGD